MYHPLLDGVVDKGDVDVDNLQPYTELIGEAQFGPVMKNILKSISLYFHVCLSTFTPQIYCISITTSSSLASPPLLGAIADLDVKIFHLQNPKWHARCVINKGSNIQCLISMHHTNIFTTHNIACQDGELSQHLLRKRVIVKMFFVAEELIHAILRKNSS
jgi:hypothetical protein